MDISEYYKGFWKVGHDKFPFLIYSIYEVGINKQ